MSYFFLAFSISFIVTVLILKTRLAHVALDKPNQRSLHTKLISRIGGLAIMSGIFITWGLLGVSLYWILLPLSLMAISLTDDIFDLSVKLRLLVQLIVSLIFSFIMLPNTAFWLFIPIVLLITWMTNLYNFMDGSDGLAAGMGLIGFSAYGIAAYTAGDVNFSIMSGVIASANFAFLIFNFHPAKIFMGDSGSIPLGFLAASMGVYGCVEGLWPAWFPTIVFSPFIVDATITLIKRQILGEKIWEPHRNHYYQRLVQMEWGHKYTAIAEYTLMLILATLSIFMLNISFFEQMMFIVTISMIYCILMWLIDQKWKKQEF